jgi:ABC-type dipeptide/oligopeptide/nickel transport system permease component
MARFFARRLLVIPLALLLVNFLSFTYAHYARPMRAARSPLGGGPIQVQPLIPAYQVYLQSMLRLDFSAQLATPGSIRTGPANLGDTVWNATKASLGLIAIASLASVTLGLALGLAAVRTNPPRVARWLTLTATVGLAMPSFYIGSLFILASIFYVLWRGTGTPIPFPLSGFGWDRHLVLPLLALMARPTVQVAQVTANLLSGELSEQYVVAARSLGRTWREIRNRLAFRPIIAPVILIVAASTRLLVGELILIEWLFRWPGLGRLLAWTLVPAQLTSREGSPIFLNPPVMALVITVIAAFFLFGDLLAAFLVRILDPRLRSVSDSVRN